jgi:hypothetical protein
LQGNDLYALPFVPVAIECDCAPSYAPLFRDSGGVPVKHTPFHTHPQNYRPFRKPRGSQKMELGKIPQRKTVRDGRFGEGGALVFRSEPGKKSCNITTDFAFLTWGVETTNAGGDGPGEIGVRFAV